MQGNNVMKGVGGWGVILIRSSIFRVQQTRLLALHSVIFWYNHGSNLWIHLFQRRRSLSQNSLSLPRPKGFGLKPQTFSALLLSSLLSASSTPDSFQNCRFARPNQPTNKQSKKLNDVIRFRPGTSRWVVQRRYKARLRQTDNFFLPSCAPIQSPKVSSSGVYDT